MARGPGGDGGDGPGVTGTSDVRSPAPAPAGDAGSISLGEAGAQGDQGAVGRDAARDVPAVFPDLPSVRGEAGLPERPAAAYSDAGIEPTLTLGPSTEPCAIDPVPVQPSLNVERKILWRTPLPYLNLRGTMALAGDRLGVVAASQFYILDRKDGRIVGSYGSPNYYKLSPPVAGKDGNFYLAGDYMVSIDPNGRERWGMPFLSGDLNKGPPANPFIISPDGILYSGQTNGIVRAIDATGLQPQFPWSKSMPAAGGFLSVLAGFGDRLAIFTQTPSGRGTTFLDRKSGDLVDTVAPAATGGSEYLRFALRGVGFMLSGITDVSGDRGHVTFLDQKLKPRWRSTWLQDQGGQRFVHVPPGNVFSATVLLSPGVGPPNGGQVLAPRYRSHACDGRVLAEGQVDIRPHLLSTPTTVGADGIFYALGVPLGNDAKAGIMLVAIDPGFRLLWKMEFPETDFDHSYCCSMHSLPLADDGAIYVPVLRNQNGGGEVIAVQTTSPGLAKTIMPRWGYDNRNSNWAY